MASGKFTHFRHSVFARNDDKMKEFSRLLERKGKEAYYYYFSLIEHCASEADEGQISFKVHNETLRNLWESNAKGVQSLCKLLANSALVVCKPCVNHVVFDIPNLPNYLGSYETNKVKKIKERKVNQTSVTDQVFIENLKAEKAVEEAKKNLPQIKPLNFRNPKVSPDQLQQTFNEMLAGKGKIVHCRGLSGKNIQDFMTTTSYEEFTKLETWKEIFMKAGESDFLKGLQENTNFTVTLNWLICHDNALKVLNGQYGGGSTENASNGLFDGIKDELNEGA